jgi:alginate O-acetyltransferase complex protein AlgI
MTSSLALEAWPRWATMWCTAAVIYGTLKYLVWQQRLPRPTPWWRHIAFLLLWPGMDVDAFFDDQRVAARPSATEWLFAFVKFGLGAIIFFGLAYPLARAGRPIAAGWCGMVGIAFLLHFGVFHLLSCVWRQQGIWAPPIMSWPILSESVTAFWGRRWNLAFRDAAFRLLLLPLSVRWGTTTAMMLVYLISGLLHELVVSWPAGEGWGWPTAYFVLQSLGMWLEHNPLGRRLGLGHGWPRRLWAVVVVALPVTWLFPLPFVRTIIAPFVLDVGNFLLSP